MQRLFNSSAAANGLRKNQLSFTFNAARAFSAGPKPNPFDKVKTSLGSRAFYKLPTLGDQRLGKCTYSISRPSHAGADFKTFEKWTMQI